MIAYLLIIALAVGAMGGGGVTWWIKDAQQARAERAQMQAEADVVALKAKLTTEQQNHIDDMQTAWENGKAQAQVIYRTIAAKGHANAQIDPALSSCACAVLHPDSLRLLQSARDNDVRSATYSAGAPAAVPETPAADGRANGNDVRSDAAGRSDVLRLQGQQGSVNSGDAVQGDVLRPHPKPSPIQ